jgi:hypothetical protein
MVTTSKVVAERHIVIVTRSRRSLNEKRSRGSGRYYAMNEWEKLCQMMLMSSSNDVKMPMLIRVRDSQVES